MKKLIFLGIFILSISVIYSQPSKVQELFGKYGGKDGFTSVNLNDPSALLSDLDNQHKDEIKKRDRRNKRHQNSYIRRFQTSQQKTWRRIRRRAEEIYSRCRLQRIYVG